MVSASVKCSKVTANRTSPSTTKPAGVLITVSFEVNCADGDRFRSLEQIEDFHNVHPYSTK